MNKIQADKVICHWAAARLRKWAKEQNAKADDASRQAHSGQGDWYSEVRLEYAKKCRELARQYRAMADRLEREGKDADKN